MTKIFIFIFIILCTIVFGQDIVINELMYDPDGSDSGYEWIELYNAGTQSVNLLEWKIQKAGTAFENVFTFPSINIQPDSFILIGESNVPDTDISTDLAFQNGGSATDGVRLVSADGQYTDTILYDEPNDNDLPDDLTEPGTTFAPDVSSGNSLARIQNGEDTDNSETDWFECENPTPGEPNIYPIDLSLDEIIIAENGSIYSLISYTTNLSTSDVDNLASSLEININDTLFGSYDLPAIESNETIEYTIELGSFPIGLQIVEAEVIFIYDLNLENNSQTISFLVGDSPLIINEIMFKPASSNQEWLEIFNRGACGYVVDNFQIIDASGGNIEFSGTIESLDFLVICRDDANSILEIYPSAFPDKIVVAENWTALNNTDEILKLTDEYGTILDSTAYSGGSCPTDFSIERVNPFDDEDIVWKICQDTLGGTPTLPNSVLPLEKDLKLTVLDLEVQGNQIEHSLLIENIGFENINSASLVCTSVLNGEYPETIIYEENLTIDDSLSFSFFSELTTIGYTTFKYEINSPEDLDTSNNSAFWFYNNNSLPFVINEIMYDPFTDEPEWLEIKINNYIPALEHIYAVISDDSISIPMSDNDFILLTDSAEDSLFLASNYELTNVPIYLDLGNLTNSGEQISILDVSGNLIETFFYDPDWNEEIDGVSIERINPFLPPDSWNWGASIDTCTPGAQNSLLPFEKDLEIVFNGFNYYDVNTSQIYHKVIIINKGLENIDTGIVRCFISLNGNENETEIFTEELSLSDTIYYDFGTDAPATGFWTYRYEIVSDEDLNAFNNNSYNFYNNNSLPFVVNEIMYDPENESEWIELKINDFIPNLDRFIVFVGNDSISINNQDVEYMLITGSEEDADSLQVLYDLENIPIITGISSLSNSGEEISILCFCEYYIENFFYDPEWNDDMKGISIERVNPELEADPSNWGPCINSATPGRQNSIFVQLLPNNIDLRINPNPFSPTRGERTIFSFELPEKLGKVIIRNFDLKGRLVRTLVDQTLQANKGDLIFDGKNDNGKRLTIGVYIILMEATSRESEKTYSKTKTVVIGK